MRNREIGDAHAAPPSEWKIASSYNCPLDYRTLTLEFKDICSGRLE